MGRFLSKVAIAILAVTATPAFAHGTASIPEGSHLVLFGLGILGVIVGRRASRTNHRRD